MARYYPVCSSDMDDCSKKCIYYTMVEDDVFRSKATDCSNPCSCYGPSYAVEDAMCKSSNIVPPSTPAYPKDENYGRVCPSGITYVAVCRSPGTANYGVGLYDCKTIPTSIQVSDAAYQTDTQFIQGYGTCSLWVAVQGFSGIVVEYTNPYADVDFCCPLRNLNKDTCGNPTYAIIYARGSNGLTYIKNMHANIFYGPFTSFPTVGSVDPVILTKADYYNSTCGTCGGEGQPECPDATDMVYQEDQIGSEEWIFKFLEAYVKPRII